MVISCYGHVAELVYAYASEAYGAILEGSSPSMPTKELKIRSCERIFNLWALEDSNL